MKEEVVHSQRHHLCASREVDDILIAFPYLPVSQVVKGFAVVVSVDCDIDDIAIVFAEGGLQLEAAVVLVHFRRCDEKQLIILAFHLPDEEIVGQCMLAEYGYENS